MPFEPSPDRLARPACFGSRASRIFSTHAPSPDRLARPACFGSRASRIFSTHAPSPDRLARPACFGSRASRIFSTHAPSPDRLARPACFGAGAIRPAGMASCRPSRSPSTRARLCSAADNRVSIARMSSRRLEGLVRMSAARAIPEDRDSHLRPVEIGDLPRHDDARTGPRSAPHAPGDRPRATPRPCRGGAGSPAPRRGWFVCPRASGPGPAPAPGHRALRRACPGRTARCPGRGGRWGCGG